MYVRGFFLTFKRKKDKNVSSRTNVLSSLAEVYLFHDFLIHDKV